MSMLAISTQAQGWTCEYGDEYRGNQVIGHYGYLKRPDGTTHTSIYTPPERGRHGWKYKAGIERKCETYRNRRNGVVYTPTPQPTPVPPTAVPTRAGASEAQCARYKRTLDAADRALHAAYDNNSSDSAINALLDASQAAWETGAENWCW